jgi:predicted ribosomally synthesized peptide with SipW-like signal peptide
MNKRILISLSVIGVAAAIAVGGTIAYFSDTETSVGNTFTAGAIDLQIDNESYVTGEDGSLIVSEDTTWELTDLTDELFFDFSDLKPGDIGEDTISLHVNSNDAWACMSIALTGTPEKGQTEPEAEVDETAGDDEGELQNELYFAFWADDGDNVYEVDEEIFAQGLAADLFNGMNLALADSTTNRWLGEGPLQGGMDGQVNPYVYHIGKVWCYGALTEEPVEEEEEGTPIERGTGFVCGGSSVTNASQTDGIVANVEFYAEQSRNNANFKCQKEFVKTQDSGQNAINQSSNRPYITYSIDGQCIDFEFVNPTNFLFVFDYRVDGEDGETHAYSDIVIHGGELIGKKIGPKYNWVETTAHETETMRVCGQNEIWAGLRVGAEQDWYLDWIKFTAQ